MSDTEAKRSGSSLGVTEFLKLLVLLYAALIPAGIWVRGEIKAGIREWADKNEVVSPRQLDEHDVAVRAELAQQIADGLGPIVTYLTSLDSRMEEVERSVDTLNGVTARNAQALRRRAVPKPVPQPMLIPRPVFGPVPQLVPIPRPGARPAPRPAPTPRRDFFPRAPDDPAQWHERPEG